MAARLNNSQSGFTLIEMIMVIVIMGALSAVAMSKFNKGAFEVAAAGGELVQAIRYAQQKSMSNGGVTNYQIAISATGYAVTQGGAAIPHPVTGAAGYTKTWADISLSPVTIIAFNSYGDPGLGAALNVTLTKGSDSAGVTIENVTGFAR